MDVNVLLDSIAELRNTEPVEENRERMASLLSWLTERFALSYLLPPGETILRGRLVNENRKLHKRTDFFYCPPERNTHYKRASTPHNTMFYGALFPDDADHTNPQLSPFAKIVVLHELVPGLSDPTTELKQQINLGVWHNKKPLLLFPVCQAKDFETPRRMIQKMDAAFEQNTAALPKALREAITETLSYLGEEFSKEPQTPADHMVSALFTELVTAQGYDGILYPSRRMEGGGLNLCLSPKAVHTKLEFKGCSEACLYKKGTESFLNTLSVVIHTKGSSIKYRTISKAEGNLSDEECWQEVTPRPKYTLVR